MAEVLFSVNVTATVAGSESSSDEPAEMEAPAEGKWCRRPLDDFPSLGIFVGGELDEEA